MEHIKNNIQKIKINKSDFKKLPETPGVYIFWANKKPIYIGKSVNLKSRLRSYLLTNLGPKTKRMVNDSEYVTYIKVFSELESLLLESSLIKKFKPKYNIISKDDKNALYIKITSEKYPRVITSRKEGDFGPFPSSGNVKLILKLIRKIFPFSDHKLGKKPCLYSHIKLCSPCPNEIENISDLKLKKFLTKQYEENIRHIKLILSRKFNVLRKIIIKKMKYYSVRLEFEKAGRMRDQLNALDYITQTNLPNEGYIKNPNLREDISKKELDSLKKLLNLKKLKHIECFDIAHLSGTNATASMVTFINGEPVKNMYKHFKIRQNKGASDFDSMKEVARRRFNHFKDWGKPDLIIVDGGIAQVKAFRGKVPIVGISKNPDRLVFPNKTKIILKEDALRFLQRIRDEAHRFARRYHHLLIKKNLLN